MSVSEQRETVPSFVQPMLAKLSATLPRDDTNWAYEMKWDGIRAIVSVADGALRLSSRNRIDRTKEYPELAELGKQLKDHGAVLDGEIVAFDENGRPTFEAWQQRGGFEGGRRTTPDGQVPIAYIIFDLLFLDGRSRESLPYTERRALLEGLKLQGSHWMVPPHSVGAGAHMLQTSREQGFEGVVAKRLNSRYEAGKRTGAWTKVKNHMRQEFVVGGWIPGEGRRSGRIGALLIGYYEAGKLISAGSVGTGFTDRMLEELGEQLRPMAIEQNPFEAGAIPRGSRFVEPRPTRILVGEVRGGGWCAKWSSPNGPPRPGSFVTLHLKECGRTRTREKSSESTPREWPRPGHRGCRGIAGGNSTGQTSCPLERRSA